MTYDDLDTVKKQISLKGITTRARLFTDKYCAVQQFLRKCRNCQSHYDVVSLSIKLKYECPQLDRDTIDLLIYLVTGRPVSVAPAPKQNALVRAINLLQQQTDRYRRT